jgi:lipopolysaccharide export LptBFGC system permease protein LptF
MLRLQRYLLGDLLGAFALVLLLLTGIVLAGSMLQLLQRYPELSISALVRATPFLVPLALPVTVPFSYLMACLLCYGRFSDDNEFLAFQMGGLSPWHALSPAVLAAVAISFCTIVINADVGPVMTMAKKELARGEIRQILEHMRRPGVSNVRMRDFEMSWDGRDGGWYLRTYLTTVIDRPGGDGEERVERPFRATADRSYLQLSPDGRRLGITLENARLVSEGGRGEQPVTAGRMGIAIDVDRLLGEPVEYASKGADSMRSDQVYYRMLRLEPQVEHRRRTQGARRADFEELRLYRRYSGEFWRRVALGLSPLAFGLLGAPLGLVVRRGSRAQALVMALLISLPVYYPLLLLGEDLNRQGTLPAAIVLNAGNVVLGAIGLAMTWRLVRR